MVDGVGGSNGSGGNDTGAGLGGGLNAAGGIGNQSNQATTDDVTSPSSPTTLDSIAAEPTTLESIAAQPTTLEALTNTPAPAQPAVEESFVCSLPTVSLGFGASAYAGVGGGANFGVSYDPKSGTLGFEAGMEVGVGVGAAGRMNVGKQDAGTHSGLEQGVAIGMGVSANGQLAGVSGRVEHEMVGSNMHAEALDRTKVSLGSAGIGASANVNVYAGGSVSRQLYDPGCAPPST